MKWSTCILLTSAMSWLGSACASPPEVLDAWSYHLGIAGQRVAADVVGDFDGDGRNEVVSNALLESADLISTTRLIVSGAPGEDPWAILGDTAFEGTIFGLARCVPRAAGDALVLRVRIGRGPGVRFETRVYSGVPLLQEYSWPSAAAWLLDVDDFDGDGDEDALEIVPAPQPLTGELLQVSDLQSAVVAWSAPFHGINSTAAAQLDADDALEIVVDGFPGEVRDGATGALEWSYADGFAAPLVGNIDAHLETTELLSSTGNSVRIFQTDPFLPIEDLMVPFGVSATQLADFDRDGAMEVVLRSTSGYDIVDRIAGTSRRLSVLSPSGIFVSVDGDDDLELVEPGLYFGGGNQTLRIFDAQNGTLEATIAGAPKGAIALEMADLDGDGSSELITLLSSVDGAKSMLSIRDAASGVLLRETSLPTMRGSGPSARSSNLAIASIDGDAALEIVVAIDDHRGGKLFAVDGLTLDVQWTVTPPDLPLGSVMLRELRIADVDVDGQLEIVALSSQTRVHVLDASTGAPEWQSIGLDSNGNQSIAVAQTDRDPGLEIVVWTGQALHVYDGQSQLLDWSQIVDGSTARMFVDSDAERCRFVRYDDTGAIWVADCHDRVFALALQLPGPIDHLQSIDAGSDLIASIDKSLLYIQARGGDTTSLIDSWSKLDASAVSGVAVAELGEGRVRVVLGRDGLLTSLVVVSDGIFFNGFE